MEKENQPIEKTSSQKAIKAGVGYTVGNYLLKGLSFITLPLFTRLLSVSDYGIYNVFISYESVLCIVVGLAIHSSFKNARYKYRLISEGAEKGHDYMSYISSSILLVLLSCCCFLILVNIISVNLLKVLELDRLSVNILVLYSFATAILQCFNSYAILDYKYKSYLLISFINAVGNILVSLILILTVFSERRYYGRLLGTFIPMMAIAIVIVFIFLNRAKPKGIFDFWKWGLSYSLPIVPHGLSQVILSQFDRIMILKMIGFAEAGIYSFAYVCFGIVAITTSSLDGAWTPWFYEQMANNNIEDIREKSSIYIILMVFFFCAVVLVCPEIIKVVGAKDYWDASYCVIPLVTGGFFSFLYNLPAGVEYFYEKTKFIMIGTVGAAILNIILNYFCIRRFGYTSAAFTTLVTYILYSLFHFLLARKIFPTVLFPRIIILASSVFILAISAFSFLLIDCVIVRWVVAFITIIAFVIFEEKKVGILKTRYCRSKYE